MPTPGAAAQIAGTLKRREDFMHGVKGKVMFPS
jgi:hypothetical protein